VLFAVAVLVVVALVGTWLVAFSSVFGVRRIEVHGTHALSADQIRTAADISNGTPLVRVDTSGATLRLEQLAEVESAQVSTSFPSTVVIMVEERTPVGYLQRAGQVQLVDRTGQAYRTVAKAPARLPRFVVPAGEEQRPIAAAVGTVATALTGPLRRKVRSIQALDVDSIMVVLTHGRLVRWGSAARSADKARVLPALLHRGVHEINVTDPDQPFTR
jgi:cell division protein FtsQ